MASGNGASLSVIDSGSNSPLFLDAKGTGGIQFGANSTGNITLSRALTYGGVTLSNSVSGTGSMVLSTSPSLTTPNLGTPSAVTLTNGTGLPLSGHTNQAAYTVVANATGSSAAPTAVSIPALTQKASPVANDKIMIADSAASDALKYATVSSLASAGSVATIAGNTGAFTLSGGITNSTNDIRLSLTNATLVGTPTNPADTSSGSNVMMGLGVTTCRITTTYSTRLLVTFDGAILNTGVGQITNVQIRYGTGAGPTNGAGVTGTQAGAQTPVGNGGATYQSGFSKTAILTGLSTSTTYWLDLALSVSGAVGSVRGLTCTAMEF